MKLTTETSITKACIKSPVGIEKDTMKDDTQNIFLNTSKISLSFIDTREASCVCCVCEIRFFIVDQKSMDECTIFFYLLLW